MDQPLQPPIISAPTPPPPPPVPPVEPPIISLPPPKKKSFAWLIILVILLLLASTGVLAYQYYQLKTQVASPAPSPSLTPSPTPTPLVSPQPSAEADDPTANWKTYTNTKHNYSVKYPTNWTFREFPESQNGAGFRPLEKPNEIQYEIISINFSMRALDSQNIPFEDYVKKAAIEDIQNYQSLATIDQVVTQTGLVGYKTTWNVIPMMENTTKTYLSFPITYFDTKDENGDTVQISLGDNTYLSIYNQILSTFKFTN